MSTLMLLAPLLLLPATIPTPLPSGRAMVKRILFLGDSITYSGGYVDRIDEYFHRTHPKDHPLIVNLGLPSETVSGLTEPGHAGGAFPRPDLHERLDRALAKFKPELVIACYGMNDGIYHPFNEERFEKYQQGILWLGAQVARAGANFCLLTPPPFDPQPVRGDLWPAGKGTYPSGHTYEGYDEVLSRYSRWLVSQRSKGLRVIDIHTPLNAYLSLRRKTDPKFAFSGDGVHLDAIGHNLIAREILKDWKVPEGDLPPIEQPQLPARETHAYWRFVNIIHERQMLLRDAWLSNVGHKRPGLPQGLPLGTAQESAKQFDASLASFSSQVPPVFPGPRTDYHGFDRFDFDVDGISVIVVNPKEIDSKANRPWIWRAEFFDHRPELDLALLNKGFHLVYMNVGNTFGAPSAMRHWDALYNLLTKTYGLSRKPTLEGLSRGGLYIYNWAAKHPNCVSVLYGDNPVCDFKSWPGGKGTGPGSPGDWQKLQADYGFTSEAQAFAYKFNPIDNLAALAKAKVPIIHCAGDADEVVPYAENTVVLKQRYEKLGGQIKVIVKHGFKHHPHGLDDPTLLVDFILAHTDLRS